MNRKALPTNAEDSARDTFAAELTRAAYCVALRHEKPGSWVDLELGLWRALGETVAKWGPQLPSATSRISTPAMLQAVP